MSTATPKPEGVDYAGICEEAVQRLRMFRDNGSSEIYVYHCGYKVVLDPLTISSVMQHNMGAMGGALVADANSRK